MIDEKIIKTALALFMKNGIKSVTMDEISTEIGISKKTLYEVFTSKKHLVEATVCRNADMIDEALNQVVAESEDALESMILLASALFKIISKFQSGTLYDLKKYYRDTYTRMVDTNQQRIYRLFKQNMELGIAQGWYREDIQPDVIARFYLAKVESIHADRFDSDKYTFQELIRYNILYHLYGILSDKGRKRLKEEKLVEKYLNI